MAAARLPFSAPRRTPSAGATAARPLDGVSVVTLPPLAPQSRVVSHGWEGVNPPLGRMRPLPAAPRGTLPPRGGVSALPLARLGGRSGGLAAYR